MAIPFFLGGGVSKEVKTLGKALPLLNDRLPGQSKTNDFFAVFQFRDPPPRVSGSAPELLASWHPNCRAMNLQTKKSNSM